MITVLTGANHFLIQKELSKLREEFVKKYGQAGVEVLSHEQIEPEQLTAQLTGVSLFADHKFIILKSLSQSKFLSEHFLKIAKQVPDEVHVLLLEEGIDKRTAFYKTLKKEFDVIEFGETPERETLSWIQDTVKSEGGTISVSDASALYQFVGSDQMRLLNEIQKLVAFQADITRDSIEELVEKKPEDTVFQLLDAALAGRRDEALSILTELEKAHEDPLAVANMLIWQTHIMAVVAAAGDRSDSEIAKQTKINPYVIQKTKRLTSRLSQKQIHGIITNVAQLDVRLKSSGGTPWNLLEQTILNLASPA